MIMFVIIIGIIIVITIIYVSVVCEGVDPTANQDDEVTDRETFQIEFDKKLEQWRVLTYENKYWSLEAASGIQAIGNAQLVYLAKSLHLGIAPEP